MSSKRGKIDSATAAASDGVTAASVAEIEAIVQKAVSAAVSVLREEFSKLFEDLNARLTQVECRMCILETGCKDDQTTSEALRELESIKKEVRECRVASNDNEQYARRNCVRIRGLEIAEGADCKQVVADFCRSNLHLESMSTVSIDAAYAIPRRPRVPSSTRATRQAGSAASQVTEPAVMVKFHHRELRDTVISKRKLLKGTKYSILEDLTNLNVMTLNRVRNDDRVQTCWSWNGRLYALLRSGIKILVKPFQPIDECQRVESHN
jgi:hypothetical protein